MEIITRTICGAQLQTCQLLGLPLPTGQYRTINELLKVSETVVPEKTDPQTLQYIMIGNGGHKMTPGVGGISKPEPVQHKARDTALYNSLPFIMCKESDGDIDVSIRPNYRLRAIRAYGGINYICYFGKKLDLTATVPKLELRQVADGGSVKSSPFTHTASDLTPTPPPISSGGVLVTSGDYIAATAKVPFVLTDAEIGYFLDVCSIIYNDDGYAMISEIALCSGVDKPISATIGGTSVTITEAINVQVMCFVQTFFAAKFTNSGIDVMFDVGSVEPLLNLTRV